MRLVALTSLVMVAFAANSILGRWAIGPGHMDALSFSLLRLVAGAAMLWGLVMLQAPARADTGSGQNQNDTSRRRRDRAASGRLGWRRLAGGASLSLYMIGFSTAYVALDAGLGALILFGVVQISMFGWGIWSREPVRPVQIGGATLALLGLAYVVWPQQGPTGVATSGAGELAVSAPLWSVALMALGGLGWGIYSLIGRGATQPLRASAVNFCSAALMVGLVLLLMVLAGMQPVLSRFGAMLAVISGALTSGLGYALWYGVLPRLSPPVAATVQLCVPVIAIFAGTLILGEPLGARLLSGTIVVLGGIALVVLGRARG